MATKALREGAIVATSTPTAAARSALVVGTRGSFLLLLSFKRILSDFLDGLGAFVGLLGLPLLATEINNILQNVSISSLFPVN